MPGPSYDFVITGRDQSGGAWESLAKQAKQANENLAKLVDPVHELQAVAEKAEAVFKGFLGFEAIRRFTAFHKSVQDSVGAIKAQADAVGFSTSALQAYQAAFRSANVAGEAGQAMLANFNVALGRAAQGDKEAAEAFQQLGVRIFDASGRVRENTTLLTEASRAILGLNDITAQATVSKTLFSKAGAQAVPVLREFARGLGDLDRAAKDAGQTLNRETIETFDKLKNQADEASIRVRNLYAAVAAPIHFEAIQTLSRLFANLAENIKNGALNFAGLVALLANPGGYIAMLGSGTPLKALQDDVATKRSQLAERERNLAGMDPNHAARATIVADVAKRRAELADLESRLQRAHHMATVSGKATAPIDDPDNMGVIFSPTGNRFAPVKPAGGGGERDRIGEGLRQVAAEAENAKEAYERLRAAAAKAISIEDLQREVDLQKKIADELAKIGKYKQDDPRIPQLKEKITLHEQYEFKIKSLEAALKFADQVERQFGDGQRGLLETQKKLNDAYATGRLSLEALTIAKREAAEKAEDMRLKLEGEKGGFDGLVAGMQYAANQWERNNRSFQQGQRLFEGVMSSMDQAINEFVQSGEINFNKLLQSFVSMIIQMEMRAAAANIWGAITGGKTNAGIGGGLLGGLFGGGGDGTASGLFDGLFTSTQGSPFMFADGGRPPVGQASIVGEEGPELFIPDSAGTIVPNHALTGGGTTVVVQQTNHFGSDVSRAEMETWAGVIERRSVSGAIAGVLEMKRAGGNYRRALKA